MYLLYFRDCGGIDLSTDSKELLDYVFWEETKTAKEKCSLIIDIFETNAKEYTKRWYYQSSSGQLTSMKYNHINLGK